MAGDLLIASTCLGGWLPAREGLAGLSRQVFEQLLGPVGRLPRMGLFGEHPSKTLGVVEPRLERSLRLAVAGAGGERLVVAALADE
jgi:hypothetical protein